VKYLTPLPPLRPERGRIRHKWFGVIAYFFSAMKVIALLKKLIDFKMQIHGVY
jgi:hypothetical protein